jgi:hypothetical protein
MSYDLVLWTGERPESDEAAADLYRDLMEEGDLAEGPPSVPIRVFVEALLQRWPDITTDGGSDSPWASGPLIDDAAGEVVTLHIVWDRSEEVSDHAARLAEVHGLNCFDPQLDALRP